MGAETTIMVERHAVSMRAGRSGVCAARRTMGAAARARGASAPAASRRISWQARGDRGEIATLQKCYHSTATDPSRGPSTSDPFMLAPRGPQVSHRSRCTFFKVKGGKAL